MTTPYTFQKGYPQQKYALVPSANINPSQRDPTTADCKDPNAGGNYLIPTIWVNTATNGAWVLTHNTGNVATWSAITDPATGNVVGPASSTDNAIARFDLATGKLIQNSVVTVADTTGTMTFPAGGGTVYTAGGAAARKGSSAFDVGGISPAIATTAVAADSVIVITRTNISGIIQGDAEGQHVTITPGVSFVVTASDTDDVSTFSWAIVA